MLIDFCLPVKDEECILLDNSLRLFKYLNNLNLDCNWRIVILVNGSTDKSFSIAGDLEKDHPHHFRAINYKLGGKSRSLKEYFKISEADILVFMDIDLAVTLNDIPALINPILQDQADIVIGSRLLPSSKTGRSALRELSSHNYNRLARLVMRNNISDLQCGFKAFKKSLFKKLEPYFQDDKWFFDAELIMLSLKFNYRLKQIPVDWLENRFFERTSKVKNSEAWYFVKELFALKKRLKKIKVN